MGTVGEVMASIVVSVSPSTTLGEAATLMAQRRVGAALVLEGERLVGIFTERDIVRALSQSFDAARHEVKDWMTRNPCTIGPAATLEQARERMLDRRFRHLPVTENGQLLGIISMRDLV